MSDEDKRPQNIILEAADRRKGSDPLAAPDTTQAVKREEQTRSSAPPPPASGDIYDMVRSIVMAALSNNVTINGQAPEVAGGAINFSTGEVKTASDKFAELNKPETKSEERKAVIGDKEATLEQRLYTPGLDAQARDGATVKEPERKMIDHGQARGIKRGGYAGRGQKTRPQSKSKIRQSDRNRKDPTIPQKTELPNKVVERDTTRDSKSFIRLLVTRGDGEVRSLVNVDTTSATVVAPEETPDPASYYQSAVGKDLNFEIRYGTLSDSGLGTITFDEDFDAAETLCFRGGLFVGKFLSSATLPPSSTTPEYAGVKHILEAL